MALDMTDPRQRQLAIDRLVVSVGPVLGRRAASVMKDIRRARLHELQQRRDARRNELGGRYAFTCICVELRQLTQHQFRTRHVPCNPPQIAIDKIFSSVGKDASLALTGNTAFAENTSRTLSPEILQGIKASLSPNRLPFVLPAVTKRERQGRGSREYPDDASLSRNWDHEERGRGSRDSDDEETVELAEKMLEAFKAGLGDPFDLWRFPPVMDSSSSSEDEWDPTGGLPYCPRPRRRISKRVANALTMISLPLGRLQRAMEAEEGRLHAERYRPWPHVRLVMQGVLAEIVAVSTGKKLLERDEIGPAPHGFCYIQVNDQVYLAAEDGDGSMVYVAEAHRVLYYTSKMTALERGSDFDDHNIEVVKLPTLFLERPIDNEALKTAGPHFVLGDQGSKTSDSGHHVKIKIIQYLVRLENRGLSGDLLMLEQLRLERRRCRAELQQVLEYWWALRDRVYQSPVFRAEFESAVSGIDVQKGERDQLICISYDNICKFSIPNFHLFAHTEGCNGCHLLAPHALTDGESPERNWAAGITKEVSENDLREVPSELRTAMSHQTLSLETYSTLSEEERRALSAEENLELDLFEQVINAGDVGPISKAAREWLNHYAVVTDTPNPTAPRPDLATPQQIKARVEYLLQLRAAGKKAAADRRAVIKARTMKLQVETLGVGVKDEVVQARGTAVTVKRSTKRVSLPLAQVCDDDETDEFGEAGMKMERKLSKNTDRLRATPPRYILRYNQRLKVGEVEIELAVIYQLASHTLHMEDGYSRESEKNGGYNGLGYVVARIIPKFNAANWSSNDEIGQISAEGLDLFEHR
ncbi:hypothetical protein C8R45DRAFT_927681 [Mycena sanguinolenta]|nr:hypothetical protein C8R45DRAFT_927681 [Mycena sanguinolenta]